VHHQLGNVELFADVRRDDAQDGSRGGPFQFTLVGNGVVRKYLAAIIIMLMKSPTMAQPAYTIIRLGAMGTLGILAGESTTNSSTVPASAMPSSAFLSSIRV
jgi:hypothetical protein